MKNKEYEVEAEVYTSLNKQTFILNYGSLRNWFSALYILQSIESTQKKRTQRYTRPLGRHCLEFSVSK